MGLPMQAYTWDYSMYGLLSLYQKWVLPDILVGLDQVQKAFKNILFS